MGRRWDAVKAIWDTAGQLVKLREDLQSLGDEFVDLKAEVERVNERTRKQVYRDKKQEEWAVFQQPQQPAGTGVSKAEVLRQWRAKQQNERS